jgi:4-amino-4-deoxy-L-arabinose transferase-like glycosyltransferase
MSPRQHRWLVLLYVALVWVPLFYNLDAKVMRKWDEARLAISAHEMQQDGDYLVVHYDGAPDMWSVKPPLVIWAQVLSTHIFGYNEFSTRLPSALSAFLCCLYLPWLSFKIWESALPGMIAGVVLTSSMGFLGYISNHGARTGDYDAPLVLCLTVLCGSYFLHLESGKPRHIYLASISATLAALTKGVAGLLMVPGLVVFTVFRRKILTVIRTPHFFAGVAIFLVFGLGYYPLRELRNPGYLKAVYENELGGRFLVAVEGHARPWYFYLKGLFLERMEPWAWLTPLAFLFGVWRSRGAQRRLYVFCGLVILLYTLVISSGATKLPWYDLPLYPFAALIVGGFLHKMSIFLTSQLKTSSTVKKLVRVAFLAVILTVPYVDAVRWVKAPREFSWEQDFYRIEYYLRDVVEGRREKQFDSIVFDGYDAQVKFYVVRLHRAGMSVNLRDLQELEIGNTVVFSQENVRKSFEGRFVCEVIDRWHNVTVLRITGEVTQ